MVLYTTGEAAEVIGLAKRTIQAYCTRYGIGEKRGRDWWLEDKDLDVIRARMREHDAVDKRRKA